MRPVSSWGRLSRDLHDVVDLDDVSGAGRRIAGSRKPGLPFGNGRSYGDVCLNAGGVLWATRGLDREESICSPRSCGHLTLQC